MRHALFAAACAAVSLVTGAGCGAEEDLSPNYEDRVPAGLALSSSDDTLTWGAATTLRGRFLRGEEPLAGEAVTVEADLYRFDARYEPLDGTTTDARGRFRFEVAPDLNTEYRATAGEFSETRSEPVRVVVVPRTKLAQDAADDGGVRYVTTFRHSAEVSLRGTRVVHYASPPGLGNRLPLVATTEVRQVRPGLSESSIELSASPSGYRYRTCIAYFPASGVGSGESCSRESVRVG